MGRLGINHQSYPSSGRHAGRSQMILGLPYKIKKKRAPLSI
jgi:hypothetical protein